MCRIDKPEAEASYQPSKLIVCFADEADAEYIDGQVEVKLGSPGQPQRVVKKEKAFSFMQFRVDPRVEPTKGKWKTHVK